jgi:hypothetical protein
MADAGIADGVFVLGDGTFHGAVGGHHVGIIRYGSLLEELFPEDLASAARFIPGEKMNGSVFPPHFLPVGNRSGENVPDLLRRHGRLPYYHL